MGENAYGNPSGRRLVHAHHGRFFTTHLKMRWTTQRASRSASLLPIVLAVAVVRRRNLGGARMDGGSAGAITPAAALRVAAFADYDIRCVVNMGRRPPMASNSSPRVSVDAQ